jgi:molecular chaperone IbpA
MASGYPNSQHWSHKELQIPKPITINSLFPNINRWAIGFDPMFETLKAISSEAKTSTYPPYNVRKVDDQHILELAVAGFAKEDITITVKELSLTVEGKLPDSDGDYVHKGIAGREFSQNFALAEYVVVKGAELKDGLLRITLEQELPEEKKPKTIEIA